MGFRERAEGSFDYVPFDMRMVDWEEVEWVPDNLRACECVWSKAATKADGMISRYWMA